MMNRPTLSATSRLSNRQWDREKPLFIVASGLLHTVCPLRHIPGHIAPHHARPLSGRGSARVTFDRTRTMPPPRFAPASGHAARGFLRLRHAMSWATVSQTAMARTMHHFVGSTT